MPSDAFAEDETLPSSGDEDSEEVQLEDEDTCTPYELEQSFQMKYKIVDESAVTLKKDYILSLCQDGGFSRIAAGLSNASVRLFDISNQKGLSHASVDSIPPPPSTDTTVNICGVRFLDETPNCLLVGTTNGLIRLFDLRTQHEQARFQHNNNGDADIPNGICCFDRNSNARLLCAGSNQHHSDVYLLFYDVRARKLMGAYTESHQDDVTSVRFHPTNPDLLCSGSTDGLINIFDLKQISEDNALLTTINTESSVHKLNWHKNIYAKDVISCITHTNDFKCYEAEEGDLIAQFERARITEAIKRKTAANCNLVDAHNSADSEMFLLVGTNAKKGEILRSVHLQNKQMLPLADFEDNKQIVRESVYDGKSNAFVTGGESGILTLWTLQTDAQAPTNAAAKLKTKTSLRPKKKTPY